jgi:Temperature dependent protein affecting M2 dsRNA replication
VAALRLPRVPPKVEQLHLSQRRDLKVSSTLDAPLVSSHGLLDAEHAPYVPSHHPRPVLTLPVFRLDHWAASRLQQSLPLSALRDASIGIDAAYYLDLRVNGKAAEPLKPALGGVPYMLKEDLKEDLLELKDAGVKPIFVFPGLDHVNKSPSESHSQETARSAENAWQKYRNKKEDEVVKEFSKAKYPIDTLFRYLQELLIENGIEFLVAPFSAIAQLSYMVKLPDEYIDAIWGSTEHFLFGVDKVIINLKIPSDKSTQVTFDFITRAACEERLKVPPEVLRDVQLILGTSFSLPFPRLERDAVTKVVSVSEAVSMLNSANRSVLHLCNIKGDDSTLEYADRYKKSIMTIRHHIVLESNGTVAPLDFAHAPGDVHDFVGQNLPEELFFYISRGIVGPEVPSWLASGEIHLSLPGGVPDFESFRHLVIEQLNPIRTQALRILSEPLNYYYKGRIVKVRTWDGRDTANLTIALRDEPDMRPKMNQWKVRGDLLRSAIQQPTVLACLQALKDDGFVSKSFTKHNIPHPALKTLDEVVANSFWRFLQIRGYVGDDHKLTRWGQVLETVLTKLVPKFESRQSAEDAAILSVELLRLGLLNGNDVDGTSTPNGQ